MLEKLRQKEAGGAVADGGGGGWWEIVVEMGSGGSRGRLMGAGRVSLEQEP